MEQYEKNIIPQIESIYNSFTPLEKTIADFFISNTEKIDLSSKSVSSRLYVSEASLSRFAKKCGYKGYREFLFCYEQGTVRNYPVSNDQTKMVLNTYQELLNKSYSLVNEEQMKRIVGAMATLKYSRQRESIREFVMNSKEHPTADTVYAGIKADFPNISLGTVYRNLSLLVDLGEIAKITTGDGPDRFDCNTKPVRAIPCCDLGDLA